jgi:hypothetical protein
VLHVVQPGDSVGALAGRWGCSSQDVQRCNPHRSWSLLDRLQPGQVLEVPQDVSAPAGLIGDTMGDIRNAAAALKDPGNIPASLAGQWQQALQQQETGGDAAGIAALERFVAQGKIDTSNPQDMQGLIDVVAGGFAVLGLPEIGAAIELLDAGAHALAALLLKVGILPSPPPCVHTGPATTAADILFSWGWPPAPGSQIQLPSTIYTQNPTLCQRWGACETLPAPVPTPFAIVAVPVFAKYTADLFNCNPTGPNNMWLLTALTALWNKAGGGAPGTGVWVPAYFNDLASQIDFQGTTAGKGGLAIPWAFQPTAKVPQSVTQVDGSAWQVLPQPTTITLNDGPGSTMGAGSTMNAGGGSSSSGATTALVALGATAAIGAAVWAGMGKPFTWDALKAIFKHTGGSTRRDER